MDSRSAGGKVFVVRPQAWARPPGYVDSFWLTALPPLSIAEALRLLVGVPLPERENSVKSWRDGSLYIATMETQEKLWNYEANRLWFQNIPLSGMRLDAGSAGRLLPKQQTLQTLHRDRHFLQQKSIDHPHAHINKWQNFTGNTLVPASLAKILY